MSEIPVQLEAITNQNGELRLNLINPEATNPDENVLCSMLVREASLHPSRFLALLLATMQIQHANLSFSLTEADVEAALTALDSSR